jgi:hypothetical protein
METSQDLQEGSRRSQNSSIFFLPFQEMAVQVDLFGRKGHPQQNDTQVPPANALQPDDWLGEEIEHVFLLLARSVFEDISERASDFSMFPCGILRL